MCETSVCRWCFYGLPDSLASWMTDIACHSFVFLFFVQEKLFMSEEEIESLKAKLKAVLHVASVVTEFDGADHAVVRFHEKEGFEISVVLESPIRKQLNAQRLKCVTDPT